MTPSGVPPILVRLRHRPQVAGLVVPWITARTQDGRHRFGTVDAVRADQALHRHWCQICGQPLPDRFVFAMRDRDLTRSIAPEAPMHPECFHYSITACPMLAGRMDHYRASGHADVFAGTGIVLGDPAGRRPGQAAEPWNAVWAHDYTLITDPHAHLSAALLLPDQILRVRPITGPAEPTDPNEPPHSKGVSA
ncbi:hypothetical protein [Actinoplanes sp. NPDC089786]|uniref:hypothetical protein n=1 Tax=Actinoplanes sp. NPDC089786 TaxID=3155185 RepID=UPI003412E027